MCLAFDPCASMWIMKNILLIAISSTHWGKRTYYKQGTCDNIGIILGMGSAKERRHFNVKSSLIGLSHTENNRWMWLIFSIHPPWTHHKSLTKHKGCLWWVWSTTYALTWSFYSQYRILLSRVKFDSVVASSFKRSNGGLVWFIMQQNYHHSKSWLNWYGRNLWYSSSVILCNGNCHYNDVIMDAIASQITSLTIVYSADYYDADQRKHQNSASLAFMRGIHRGPVNSPHKWPVTRKMFPFDDVIMHPGEEEGNRTAIVMTWFRSTRVSVLQQITGWGY